MAATGSFLAIGRKLPVVVLPATGGEAVDLSSLTGRGVVAIYPWTGVPGQPNPPHWDDIAGAHGSTPELEGFRDLSAAFAARDVSLFGLSDQTTAYQIEMAARLKLPFPILSDAGGAFATALSLPTFETGGVTYLKRLTLLIREGAIEHVFSPVPDPAGHAREVLTWIAAQNTSPRRGEVGSSAIAVEPGEGGLPLPERIQPPHPEQPLRACSDPRSGRGQALSPPGRGGSCPSREHRGEVGRASRRSVVHLMGRR
jgi:peroxiredoxin